MEIENITAGESWACKFRTRTFVNEDGKPVSTKHLQPGDRVPGKPGDYEGFGVITIRDTQRRLVEILDQNIPDQSWVVSWDDCWDIDRVEWVDNTEE